MIRDGKEGGRGKWERCQAKIKQAGGGGICKEGVQVCVCRCVQMHAGRGPGEGERLGHVCRDRIPAEVAGAGPVSEATEEYVCLCVANCGKDNMKLTAQKYARRV